MGTAGKGATFTSAGPIWPAGLELEMNLLAGFKAVFAGPRAGEVILRITGSSFYRVWLNGRFVLYGPARCGHGYYRVDEVKLPQESLGDANILAVEVNGYNVPNYCTTDHPSFVQAEVICDGRVLASTDGEGSRFKAYVLKHRLQKIERYSMQRGFSEYYRMPGDVPWWDDRAGLTAIETAVQERKELVLRGLPIPEFRLRQPILNCSTGTVATGLPVEKPSRGWTLTQVGVRVKSYPVEEFEAMQSIEVQGIRNESESRLDSVYDPQAAVELGERSYHICDFGTNLTGFAGAIVECDEPVRFVMTFDELLRNGDVDARRMGCVNVIVWELGPGRYELETFEPYTLRYLKAMTTAGSCRVTGLRLRELANPESCEAEFACDDVRLNKVFDAAVETFRQNAVDVFMDCPSRERAGWLCDSFFTARAAFDISGNASVERNFYENYLLPEKYPYMAEGMLPMCYPSDEMTGNFIPNWAMWFVIELEEYLARSGDRAMVDALRPRVMTLLDFFRKFENTDGLLEKLEGWVFIEWSEANKFVQDVNYPTNMTYAATLEAAGRIYGQGPLLDKAQNLRAKIREQSFDGEFFVDNAVREEGVLKVTSNRSEVCQYYAFFTGVATPELYPELWRRLYMDFGPQRVSTKAFPEIHKANAFIGNFLRLELLGRQGLCRQVKEELAGYFLGMAESTGTLWELDSDRASCNHGFASHAAHSIYRDVLGVRTVDIVAKVIEVRIVDVGLNWCRGSMPVPGGRLRVSWSVSGANVMCRAEAPAGYRLRITAAEDVRLLLH